jgi:hypothetical protein
MADKGVDEILYPLINLPTEYAEEKYIGRTCIICGFPFDKKVRKEAVKKVKSELLSFIWEELNQAVIDADHKYEGEDLRHAFNHVKADMFATLTRLFSKGEVK